MIIFIYFILLTIKCFVDKMLNKLFLSFQGESELFCPVQNSKLFTFLFKKSCNASREKF